VRICEFSSTVDCGTLSDICIDVVRVWCVLWVLWIKILSLVLHVNLPQDVIRNRNHGCCCFDLNVLKWLMVVRVGGWLVAVNVVWYYTFVVSQAGCCRVIEEVEEWQWIKVELLLLIKVQQTKNRIRREWRNNSEWIWRVWCRIYVIDAGITRLLL
jgi:hypothetical protein